MNVYQIVTDRIIHQLREGTIPLEKVLAFRPRGRIQPGQQKALLHPKPAAPLPTGRIRILQAMAATGRTGPTRCKVRDCCLLETA